MSKNRGQSAIEFLILIGAVFFFFIVFLFAIQSSIVEKSKEGVDLEIREVALIVQDEISLAVGSSDGYSRNFVLPNKIRGRDYNASIIGSLVYVITNDGKHAVSLSVLNATGQPTIGNNQVRRDAGRVYLNS
jgi:uncharacterized protein YpmB